LGSIVGDEDKGVDEEKNEEAVEELDEDKGVDEEKNELADVDVPSGLEEAVEELDEDKGVDEEKNEFEDVDVPSGVEEAVLDSNQDVELSAALRAILAEQKKKKVNSHGDVRRSFVKIDSFLYVEQAPGEYEKVGYVPSVFRPGRKIGPCSLDFSPTSIFWT
jgi:hypothetical protein